MKYVQAYSYRRALKSNGNVNILDNNSQEAKLLSDSGVAGFSEWVAALDRTSIALLRGDRKGERESNGKLGEHFEMAV